MHDFTPLPALLGGAIIGLSATLYLLTHGKVAGISGIFGGLFLPGSGDRQFRAWFIAGLVGAGVLLRIVRPSVFTASPATLGTLAVAGLLVGYGTRLANGCTSGHGVCGLSRFSVRSLAATITFMVTGAMTVFLTGGVH
jgi:uncharacterized membrane protein YedE/YeeE